MSWGSLTLSLALAIVRPATTPRPDPGGSSPVRPPETPPVSAQARRRHRPADLDMIERDHPGWTVWTMPTGQSLEATEYVATCAGHTVCANTVEALRHQITEVETEPPPELVRRYIP